MTAILKRELHSYLISPFGYIFIAAYFLFAGYFFFDYNLYGNSPDMRGVFGALFVVTVFLIPVLTMRMISEDRKLKTDKLYYMSPVSMGSVVIGKFLAGLIVYFIAMSITLVEVFVISLYGEPEMSVFWGHFIGLFLLGAALISIGLYISSLTENQITAAIVSFCTGIFLILIETLAAVSSNNTLSAFIRSLSFESRYFSFTLGVLNLSDILFFVSVAALFVFLTVCSLEKRRFV